MKIKQLKSWQVSSDSVITPSVQLWTNGIMVTAMLTNKEAKQMVENGEAFVITSQAIGSIKNGKTFS